MTGTPSGDLRAGVLFLEQGRHDLAEQALRRQLAQTPDNGLALALLALALTELGRKDEAERAANDAVSHAPETAFSHYALARALAARERYDAAATAALEAVRLDPEDPRGFAMLAAIRHDQRRYRDAVTQADLALAIDPEHTAALNVRGLALTQLGEMDAAHGAFEGVLRRDPENAYAIASRAMTQLHEGRYKEAQAGFRESLRLDPTNEMARYGLVEALKARSPIYAALLRFLLWSSRLPGRQRLFLFLGFFLFTRALRTIQQTQPALAPLVFAILVGYTLFVWLTFAGPPLFNLLLRADPFGRHALSDEQRMETNAIGPLVAIGLPAAVIAMVTQAGPAVILAVVTLGAVIPVALTFGAEPGKYRVFLAIYSVAVLVVGAAAFWFSAFGGPRSTDTAAGLFVLALLLVILSTWLSVPGAFRNRPR